MGYPAGYPAGNDSRYPTRILSDILQDVHIILIGYPTRISDVGYLRNVSW
jgi:hypothetical protein